MIQQLAIITHINAQHIECQFIANCSQCQLRGGCGLIRFGNSMRRYRALKLPHSAYFKVGDRIMIQISQRSLWSALWWLCVLPLLGLLIGAVAANFFINGHEIWDIFGAIMGCSFAYLLAYYWQRRCPESSFEFFDSVIPDE
jgi:positive regulator of sigma E activity